MTDKQKLPTQNYEVSSSNPWENSLGREVFGKYFCKFLCESLTPTVIELAAGYGEGKSTFLKRCEYHIALENNDKEDKDKINVININIWENDYNGDPLITLLKELNTTTHFQGITKEIAKFTLKAFTHTVNIAGNYLGAGNLGDLLSDDNDNDNPKKLIETIKSHLHKKSDDNKTIIFIDELDRCRPDYAIRTLEVIKHIFSVDNIVFVLATDDNRLQSAVNSVYGSGTASEDYLRKFIDIQFTLPSIDNEIQFLISRLRFWSGGILKASLRELKSIEYYIENSNLKNVVNNDDFKKTSFPDCFMYNPETETNQIYIIAFKFMYYLRHIKPNLYFKIGNGAFIIEEMLEQLKFDAKDNIIIKTKQDFKIFLQFICRDNAEYKKFLQSLFNQKELHILNFTQSSTFENLRDISDNCRCGISPGQLEVLNNQEKEGLFDKIQEHALSIYLNNKTKYHSKSIAQEIYQILEH